jgi:ABC-type transport system substrate-binding protein
MLLAGALLAGVLSTAGAQARDLRINTTADPEMIDPITYSALIAGDVLRNVYESFSRADREGNIVPILAESWETHPDNLGWRFHLRRNAKFHSGRPFTARDVKYTFEQLLLPGNRAGLARQYLMRIEGAQAMADGRATELAGARIVDDNTIDIRFTAPDVLFPVYPFMFIDSETVRERGIGYLQEASAGTGPYRLDHWRRGQQVRLAAHRDYWGGAPRIDGITWLIVPSEDTAISMYDAGELDVLMVASTDLSRRIMRDQALRAQAITSPIAQINYLGMNQNLYPPFRDRRVREAFCISIDREAMSRGLFGGLASPLYGQITPGVAGYNPANIAPIRYAPERAQRLMAEAGFPGGRGMPPLKIANLAQYRNEIAYFSDQWRQVLGVTVELDIQERATFLRALNAGETPFFSWGWTADYPDALYFLSQVWHSSSTFNRARYRNPEFDRLIDQAQITPDNPARFALYHQAERLLLDDWGTCGLYIRTQIALVKPNVHGVIMTPYRLYSFAGVSID